MSGTSRSTWAGTWIAPALLLVLAFAVFARSTGGAFVFDDHRFILNNPHVQATESWSRLLTDATTVDPEQPRGIVRPLRTLEFAADRAASGGAPSAFHLHSMLWHAVSALLLLAVLRRLVPDSRASLFAAAVWTVHPAHVESVAWISSRGDVAMGACALGSIWFALRARGWGRDVAISAALALVGTLYKETALAIPIVIVALRITKRSRAPLLPYVAAAGVYLGYRFAAQAGPTGHGVSYILGGSTAGTIATMIRGFGFYLAETFLPAQTVDWFLSPSTSFADAAVLGWLGVHAALAGCAIAMRNRVPLVALAIAWFYAFLLPVANWPFYVGIPTGERFLYLPLAGAAIALACALTRLPRALPAAGLAAAAFAAISVDRCGVWRTEDALWRSALEGHGSPRAHEYFGERLRDDALSLGTDLMSMPPGAPRDAAIERMRGLREEALGHFHAALAVWCRLEGTSRPTNTLAGQSEVNASNMSWFLGRDAEALFHADEALRVDDRPLPQPHYDRALALSRLGFAPQAVDAMERARDLGFSEPDLELCTFFLSAGAACESDGLLVHADRAFHAALILAPGATLRRDAAAAVERVKRAAAAHPVDERAKLAQFDERLARLPRSCPQRPVFAPE